MGELVLHHDGLSRPLPNAFKRYLSLGAGWQSTALALMSARGELPLLDAAIFANTGNERRRVYRHLDWLETQLPFPLIRVSRPGPTLGEYMDEIAARGTGLKEGASAVVPLYLADPDGVLPKQCNAEFKRDVVAREISRLIGGAPRDGKPIVELWIGMSVEKEELSRVGRNRRKYIHNRYPLIEARMTRADCGRWLAERQYPPAPKSACIYCPYWSDDLWHEMKEHEPEDFAEAVAFDRRWRGMTPEGRGSAYVHRSRQPLDRVDFTKPPTPGDSLRFGFANECEGYCGA